MGSAHVTDQVFLLPDLGEGLSDAVILEWRVAVGDAVQIDQVVVEVETAKAMVEIPIPFAGTVTVLHGQPGATLEVGAPLITISATDTAPVATVGSGNVLVGYGTTAPAPRRQRRRPTATASVPATRHSANGDASAARVISPVVRALARSTGVDLAQLVGTGAGSVITRTDVEKAAARSHHGDTNHTGEGDRVVAIAGFRKAVADKLATSRREIPDATTWVDVDATALIAALSGVNALLPEGEKVGLMAVFARLTVAALQAYPELNSTVDTARGEITQHCAVHLGVATQTPRGLVVPVIRHADEMSTAQLGQALKETTQLARSGKLGSERLSGGTFTLNNYGVFGVDGSTPIINHPEAAILGVGRIVDKPWVHQGQLTVRKVAQLSLSFDHRVCDGGTAGGLLRLVGDFVENPVAALGRI